MSAAPTAAPTTPVNPAATTPPQSADEERPATPIRTLADGMEGVLTLDDGKLAYRARKGDRFILYPQREHEVLDLASDCIEVGHSRVDKGTRLMK